MSDALLHSKILGFVCIFDIENVTIQVNNRLKSDFNKYRYIDRSELTKLKFVIWALRLLQMTVGKLSPVEESTRVIPTGEW